MGRLALAEEQPGQGASDEGMKVTNQQKDIHLERHDICPAWNYTSKPIRLKR